MRASIALTCALLLVAAPAGADVVVLRDGRVLEGETRWTPEGLEVAVRFGAIVVPHDAVLRIEVRETARQRYARLLEALPPDDPERLVDLVEHCSHHDLAAEARPLIQEALLSTPNDPRLHAALERLDFHRDGDRWVPPEQYYPARGYVRDRGRWLSPARARLVAASRRLRAATQEADQARHALADAADRVDEARRDVRRADRAVATLTAAERTGDERLRSARAALEAREQDLTFAREQALAATLAHRRWLATPCTCSEPDCAWSRREAWLRSDLALWAQSRVPAAERARDAAAADLARLEVEVGRAPLRRAAAEERRLDQEAALGDAEAALDAAERTAELAAASLATARREREAAQAAVERADAPAPAQPAEAPPGSR